MERWRKRTPHPLTEQIKDKKEVERLRRRIKHDWELYDTETNEIILITNFYKMKQILEENGEMV